MFLLLVRVSLLVLFDGLSSSEVEILSSKVLLDVGVHEFPHETNGLGGHMLLPKQTDSNMRILALGYCFSKKHIPKHYH